MTFILAILLPSYLLLPNPHLNIRSLQKHYQDLIPYITDINLDALCLTETHTDQYNKYKILRYILLTGLNAPEHFCC